jgi:choline dehydrogenase
MQEFDYVVVGAGSAGCVVAARLSESGEHQVALLEAGGEDDSFWIHTPLGYGKLYDNPKYNWLYEAEPEPELGGHKSYQPRGKVLGGTGSINGMIYMRGQPEDFAYWRQLGNVGWSYDDVLPYYKRSEDNVRGESEYHGVGGPVRVSDAPRHELADAFIRAAEQAGFPRNDDFNGAVQEGFGYNQMTIRDGRRSGPAVAFLRPARHRPNLHVITHAQATRVLFRGREAVGVEYQQNGAKLSVGARREVIICGGAINSPHLLQLSGIGPGALLNDFGIPVIADRPGVGQNLQDHFFVPMTYRCTKPITINDIVNNPMRRLAEGARYLLFRTGALAANASLCGGCVRTDPSLSAPDVKLNLQLWHRAAHGRSKRRVGLAPYSSFSTNAVLLHPENRGTIRLKSPDPTVHPEMRFNLFVSERDRDVSIRALRMLRRIMGMPAMAPYVAEEEAPGRARVSDAELLAYCRERGRSNHHAASSCKMGVDDMAVVDPRLRVHGVDRLRVADASIMPRIVSGNTHAPAMMIGEKAAAMILEDAKNAPHAVAISARAAASAA